MAPVSSPPARVSRLTKPRSLPRRRPRFGHGATTRQSALDRIGSGRPAGGERSLDGRGRFGSTGAEGTSDPESVPAVSLVAAAPAGDSSMERAGKLNAGELGRKGRDVGVDALDALGQIGQLPVREHADGGGEDTTNPTPRASACRPCCDRRG